MLNLAKEFKHIISSLKILKYVNERTLFTCKVIITFYNKSTLSVKEYRFANKERKYSFHWMDKNHKMIIRWDNAEHWKNISTFPHHKHIGKNVFPTTEITLEQVLIEIEKHINRPKN
ncbi:MAG: hypothetical protein A3H98_08735 [Bacteroidetes bacterium RIFCSPLOWO2_02_FULL_36_8]|nr:MAG: hypothetical protein A3H98_08735 [Bacteroidetes bacterium RIFCSPLOWO2_02_FULL_36_8]OFY70918.1 MAG: hypothetical protein A3G23_12420 [Bacteroidetes bacterium RIFCSPLOWO2_12_FULL_37_12]